jgi:VIT1/CCC1 family predicted Fe2+/Mn2+ transporter
MQVDLVLHAELAATQMLEQARRVAVLEIHQFIADLDRGGIEVAMQEFIEHRGLIGGGHARAGWRWRAARRRFLRRQAAQRPDRGAE